MLVAGRQAGAELDALTQVMGAGSANSTMLQLEGRPMLDHDFTPLFKLEHMLKDVRLRLDETRTARPACRSRRSPASCTASASAAASARRTFAAVLEVIEGMAGARV